MTTFDKVIGAFLFFIALPAAIQADVNGFAIGFLVAACVIFLGFVIQAKKKRCNRCGHYYFLTTYEAYVKKQNTKRCENCALVHENTSHENTHTSGSALSSK